MAASLPRGMKHWTVEEAWALAERCRGFNVERDERPALAVVAGTAKRPTKPRGELKSV